MKTDWLSMICVVFNLFNFQGNVLAQTIEVKNMTNRQYQNRFNELTQEGYRPIKVTAKALVVIDYDDNDHPDLGYWATFQKQPNSPAWAAQHGLTPEAYQQSFNHWTAQGYMPTDIHVVYLDHKVSYSVIFDKVTTPVDWQARHGLNYQAFQQTNQMLTKQGFKLKIQTNCNTSNSSVYAALWVKEKAQPVVQPMTQPVQTTLRMKRNW
jgi:hypothetical protein